MSKRRSVRRDAYTNRRNELVATYALYIPKLHAIELADHDEGLVNAFSWFVVYEGIYYRFLAFELYLENSETALTKHEQDALHALKRRVRNLEVRMLPVLERLCTEVPSLLKLRHELKENAREGGKIAAHKRLKE